MIKPIKLLLLLICITVPGISIASHMLGAEVTYKYLGNKKYEVTAKVYRDCKGIPLNSPAFNVSDYNGTTISISYKTVSIEDVTFRCSDTVAQPCKPKNTTVSNVGMELHTFVGTVDFGTAPFNAFPNKNACNIYFYVSQCCRNNSVTTMNQGDFFVEAMLDICKTNYNNSSPQFTSVTNYIAICNQPFRQSFGARDFTDFDSVAFTMHNPLNAPNSPETYLGSFSARYPMTPFCTTTGVINCKPNPNAYIGFYIDSLTGDIIFKPTKCTEVGVISVKASEFRKDPSSGKWTLIGYVVKEAQIIVINASPLNIDPSMTLSKTYNFKTRQNTCINITTSDGAPSGAPSGNKGDKTVVNVQGLPPGATYQYVDSSSKNKTGKFCWKIHDSVYLKYKNKDKLLPLTVELKDNFCDLPVVIQRSFKIKILPPDSMGTVVVNSFVDKNKNNFKDSLDRGFPIFLKFKYKKYFNYDGTNEDGQLETTIPVGLVNIAVASHPYYTNTVKDTNLLIKMDATHLLNYGIQQNYGLYGRIYEDANSNCRYDKGEKTFAGYKVFTDSNKYVGISDNNGLYYINAPKGSYKLRCEFKPSILKINCPSSQTINAIISKDSVYWGNDFGISKNINYTDIGTGVSIARLRRGNSSSVTLYCINNGPTIRRNIKLYSPVNSNFNLKYNNAVYAVAGTTAVIRIDSILPYKTFTMKFDFDVSSTSFNGGDYICFSVHTDTTNLTQDSVKTNNLIRDCRRVDAPFDPNEKLISIDSTRTPLDKTIDYTVHFQNTGTDTAFRIIVKDTIDSKFLDLEKFNLNWSDFPCETIISGNEINFIFDNIKLPYLSKSGDKSIAGFNFTLGLKSNVPVETSFNNHASICFDFENPILTKDAIANIVSPIILTNLKTSGTCKNESNTVYYQSKIPLDSGNQLILEMSDAGGSFTSPTFLSSVATTSRNDSIDFILPKSANGVNYTLRIRSTLPASTSILSNGYKTFKLLSIPGYQINSNLINNSICEKDTLKLNFSNTQHLYKVIRNNIPLNSFSGTTSYKFVINLNDSLKIIAMDSSTGCKDTSIIQPLIYKKPSISSIITNRKKEYCQGEQIEINASGGLYYTYLINNKILSGKSLNSKLKTTLDSSSVYRIKGDDNNGCSNLSDTMNIVVNPSPVATISTNKNPICSGNSMVLSFGQGQSYDLYNNNFVILRNTNLSSYTINSPVNGDKYKVTAYTSKGCSSTSQEINVVVNTTPIATLTCSANPVCPDDTATLFFGKANQYDLFKNNAPVLSKTSDSIFRIHPHNNGDKYYIIAFSKNGCSANSSDFVISTKPAPLKPTITKNGNTLITNATGIIKWFKNGILLSNTSNTIANAGSGTYKVIVTNTDGCSNNSDNFIHQNSGIQYAPFTELTIFPNPASQELTIENSTSGGPFSVSVYDMKGQLMISSIDNIRTMTIDIRLFASGLYTVRIGESSGNFTTRMISIIR